MIRQVFREESMNHTWKSQTQQDQKWQTSEEQSQEHAHHFLISRGLFTKISFWQAKQSSLLTTVTFYGDCVEMCEDFTPKFGEKRTGCCITTTHCLTLLFSPANFSPKQHDYHPLPTLLFCFADCR
jgi:hypothetical protein